MWSMLPAAQTLSPTRVTGVSTVSTVGFANVHTLQGQPHSTIISCCREDGCVDHGGRVSTLLGVQSDPRLACRCRLADLA